MKRRISPTDYPAIVQQYRDGFTLREIAAERLCCPATIRSILHKLDEPLRPRGRTAKHGLTHAQIAALWEEQGRICPICRVTPKNPLDLHLDHDHATGKARGLLCRGCNTMLGHRQDSPDFFRRAYMYLRKYGK